MHLHPQRLAPALIQGTVEWTHAELAQRVEQAARAFPGDTPGLVFLYAPNDLASVVALLGARRARHPVVLLDPLSPPQVRQDLEARYRPRWVLAPRADRSPGQPLSADELQLRDSPQGPLHPELALLLSTSGSTGSPRLVRLSEQAVRSNAAAISQALGISPDSRALLTLPLHYSFGLSVLNSQLLAGASVVLSEASPAQRQFWSTLADRACTTWAAVPYGYELFLRLGGERLAPPPLRDLLVAGGHLPAARSQRLAAWLAERGGRLFRMYGQTEATARMAVLPPELAASRPEAAGVALPGGRFWIDPLQGEVVYRGPNVMMGYASDHQDLARGDELGGELRTGDLGSLDEAGILSLHGRMRRFAKIHGQRVALDEVEALCSEHSAGAETCAALAGEDQLRLFGEWPAALDLEALRTALATRLRLHPSALRLARRLPLPRLPSGKIDYAALADPSPADPSPAEEAP